MSWLKFWKVGGAVKKQQRIREELKKDHSHEIIPQLITIHEPQYIADSQFKKPWLKNEVRDYLKTSMECRESDEVLCAAIWRSQINKMQGMNLYSFISLYEHKKVATAGSITRVRRLLQEQNPELRGSNWTKRHEQEQVVREEARAAKWTEGMKPTEGA